MNIMLFLVFTSFYTLCNAGGVIKDRDIWLDIECDEEYKPDNCDFDRIPDLTVEDFERCAPAKLPLFARNYYLGWDGRGLTYKWNQEDYKKIRIIPKMLRDLSNPSLEVTVLGQKLSFPVGISPTAVQKLADPKGEIATANAAAEAGTVMILSCFSTTSIEDVAAAVPSSTTLWMQTFNFRNRSIMENLVQRSEKNGFKAIVLTTDTPFLVPAVCNARKNPGIANIPLANFPETFDSSDITFATTDDIRWLRSITNLPIIAKGLVRGEDAQKAVLAGASAIIVSNHGGRQLDSGISTIDALPEVVRAVRRISLLKRAEVYIDGGVRNGYDVYKALARGAKMVFVGRPVLWGLTLRSENGIKQVLNILKTEFNNTMLLAGSRNPSEIRSNTIRPAE